MLHDGDRGFMEGAEAAKRAKRNVGAPVVFRYARLTYARLDRLGYAHIAPRGTFLVSFIVGWRQVRPLTNKQVLVATGAKE